MDYLDLTNITDWEQLTTDFAIQSALQEDLTQPFVTSQGEVVSIYSGIVYIYDENGNVIDTFAYKDGYQKFKKRESKQVKKDKKKTRLKGPKAVVIQDNFIIAEQVKKAKKALISYKTRRKQKNNRQPTKKE